MNRTRQQNDGDVVVMPDQLRDFVARLLHSMELPLKDAETVAHILVEADLRGVESHGVTRLHGYIQMIRSGLVNPTPKLSVSRETNSTAVLDGDMAFGMIVAKQAMEMAISKAHTTGVSGITARNMTHTGMVGFYTMMAAKAGMVGIAMNNGPTIVPPFGGKTPTMAPNPFSVAFPAGDEQPIVLDMATTMVAAGKLRLAAKKGIEIPADWATDQYGQPTTDPNEAIQTGWLQWAGGYKGFGIALMIEALSGVLSGGLFGRDTPTMKTFGKDPLISSGFYLAVNVTNFMPINEFKFRIDRLIRQIKSSDNIAGVPEVYVSGEPESLHKAHRSQNGIPLSMPVYRELLALSQQHGVPLALQQK